ncbi:hypothetical protein IB265_34650 [Ensifer sp. ENS10]|uniref:hypothetical protein n=1 Tax=Ensifer sp. ENS10 TaxID=2769286 RepID=UPI000DE1D6C2|nr:hypothetical protein [Ensifer sp. ENS10]MBD9511891.1 hypothetical protein [Ensifer sp. ENS10]
MAISIDTLGKAALQNMFVVVECRRCGKQATFAASDLCRVYGFDRDPRKLRFKCETCDTYECRIMMAFPDFDRKPEKVIWRPVTVKG